MFRGQTLSIAINIQKHNLGNHVDSLKMAMQRKDAERSTGISNRWIPERSHIVPFFTFVIDKGAYNSREIILSAVAVFSTMVSQVAYC